MKKGRIRTWTGTGFLLMAVAVLLYPDLEDMATRKESEAIREAFIEQEGNHKLDITYWEDPEMSVEEVEKNDGSLCGDSILERIIAYNTGLLDGSQKEAIEYREKTNAWDEEKVFGTIQIPSIGVDMPLYIGASEDHLAAGAAVLEGTSIPIGGECTNSVIAGHRGWKGAAYFKEIESVLWGDEIIVTNVWGNLSYRVVDMDIIEPNEICPLLIQEGRDMITIVTCHPYREPRDKRYVLYAERVFKMEEYDEVQFGTNQLDSKAKWYYLKRKELRLKKFGDSHSEIQLENIFRWCMGGILVGCILNLIKCVNRK